MKERKEGGRKEERKVMRDGGWRMEDVPVKDVERENGNVSILYYSILNSLLVCSFATGPHCTVQRYLLTVRENVLPAPVMIDDGRILVPG